ncbi:MAG: asparagine synthase (glutamine-hydrolyzing) [Rhodocyclaceae bacterium]|nr:asparagine synthase (glutamine-hydrolyzing) [Rhodocyclaceae bacterium]
MCGLFGFFTRTGFDLQGAGTALESGLRALRHRGPDDSGTWMDAARGIALGHRRLSVLDLSPAGHQPMDSACGRFVIVFNGEIYNHLELRRELGAGSLLWRGHSDTETLLAGISAWGVEATLKRSVGMFAFALWDRLTGCLTLARDRMGEKPLYYGWQGETFLFGSELKALLAHPAFENRLNRDALASFLRANVVPAPQSIYQGIFKLPPGTSLRLEPDSREARPVAYWSVREAAEAGLRSPFAGTDAEAVSALDALLRQSVAGQMISDVPLGAFLSGGVDSSAVVALMQAEARANAQPAVKTFTIGFHEAGYNEAQYAHAVAAHLGTEHTELYVSAETAMAVIPELPRLYDEPFADSSQIPTFLVAQLARNHVTVSLSGDGGDELFGGYNRYSWVPSIWRRLGWAPRPLRAALAGILTTFPPHTWNRLFQQLARWLPAGWRYANPGDKLHKLADILAARSPEDIYLGLVSHWKTPASVVRQARETGAVLTDHGQWTELPDFENRMMYLDQMTYLPDDILTKVDRAAMGVSLETRVPMLDHRLVEFAWSLPLAMKIRQGQGKWLLRQLLYRHVPQPLIERPKMGFGLPLDVWLLGPLRNWAESLLDEGRLIREGYFNPEPIRAKWQEHLSGRRNWSHYLWDILMFQAWLEARS